MKSSLAKNPLTPSDVIEFLDKSWQKTEELRSRFVEPMTPATMQAISDIEIFQEACTTIASKLRGNVQLSSDEKAELVGLLMSEKRIIQQGMVDGTVAGIDDFISKI